jgi:hypothetical protein
MLDSWIGQHYCPISLICGVCLGIWGYVEYSENSRHCFLETALGCTRKLLQSVTIVVPFPVIAADPHVELEVTSRFI